jgi:hypothetical protein
MWDQRPLSSGIFFTTVKMKEVVFWDIMPYMTPLQEALFDVRRETYPPF